jgi:GntR family transcriptional regulator
MLGGLVLQNNGIPIYVQLREQILAAIGSGALSPGSRLPTMRQVAVLLHIDLNTVQRAYAELEREGILTMVQGRGSFVAEVPPSRNRKAETRELALKVSAQAQALGITLDDLTEALAGLRRRAP